MAMLVRRPAKDVRSSSTNQAVDGPAGVGSRQLDLVPGCQDRAVPIAADVRGLCVGLAYREDGTKLDRLLVTNDPVLVP
jgi:hypothetical protein